MIAGVAMKGKWIITPFKWQKQILDQLHSNHMGIEKFVSLQESLCAVSTWMLTQNAWSNLEYQGIQHQEKALHY